jgi:hypothetical protein
MAVDCGDDARCLMVCLSAALRDGGRRFLPLRTDSSSDTALEEVTFVRNFGPALTIEECCLVRNGQVGNSARVAQTACVHYVLCKIAVDCGESGDTSHNQVVYALRCYDTVVQQGCNAA